jgi:adenylate cyclase
MKKPTLAQLFVVAVAAIVVVVLGASVIFLQRSERAVADAARAGREDVAKRVQRAVVAELARATGALEHVQVGVRTGAIAIDDEAALESVLFLEALTDAHLAEVTFTRATLEAYDERGEARVAPRGRRQTSLLRMPDGRVVTRITRGAAGGGAPFQAFERARSNGGAFDQAPLVAAPEGTDPTTHLTFVTLAAKRNRGRAIWSDLHFAESDAALPVAERRVVLTIQKAIENASGEFVGVARVGLLTTELDALARSKPFITDPDDPHTIALFALSSGDSPRADLVARVDASDRAVVMGDDVRFVSSSPPAPVAALVASPLLAGLDASRVNRDGALMVGEARYLATLREVATTPGGTSGWFVAVLGPEAYYTHSLRSLERSFALAFVVTLVLVIGIGALTVRALQRGLATVVASTTRMRGFDFAPSPAASPIRDIDEVTAGLERAKTVVRAMGKYVPVELVRRLYATNEDPKLGGEIAEISLMFTDIEGFTSLSEKLPPGALAERLGDYLEAMTGAIEACDGTIDKYIGDAVMAFWNAPLPVAHHAVAACRAALAAMRAARDLYASEAWRGLPPLVTRFGLHRASVLVGHFGAPTRLSYTALGDGVNLAARLEPLCKQYGVVVLASEDIVADAKDAFVFRRIDRVAVKGKTRGIEVFELLGAVGDELPKLEAARTYEAAFDAYLARDFPRAAALLAPHADDDPPSAVLRARCLALEAHPPPAEWDGVHVATSK